jgi:predicted ester cyclase
MGLPRPKGILRRTASGLRRPDHHGGIIVVEGDHVACQTTIAGTFAREFTHSPVGLLPPNGNRVVFELMNSFRYDDAGRLAEEWIQTDNRSALRQLGAGGLLLDPGRSVCS